MEHNNPGDEAPRDSGDDPADPLGAGNDASRQNWWDQLRDPDEPEAPDDPLAATAPLPLPPEDRLWRHPSELVNAAGPGPDHFGPIEPASSGFGLRGVLTATAAAALAGAMIAGAAVWLIGPSKVVTERVVERHLIEPSSAIVNASIAGLDVVNIAEIVKPSIVRVEILNRLDNIVGSGSGVIFRDDGHILTNSHVVAGASGIEVVMSDGRRYEADLVGADELTDVAVIKIEASAPFPAVLIGSTSRLRVGEPAIAVGSPLRLAGGPTVTVGVVSAIGRTLDLPTGGRLFDLVQTDAPISPGSSGGALVDGSGSLIGLTTVIAVSDVGAEGLGFATPVEIAHDIALDLVVDGEVRHGFLGISGDDLGHEQAQEDLLEGGAVITAVGTDTPAETAGIEVGDIVISVDGTEVLSMSDLVVRIRRLEPGDPAEIVLVRGRDTLMVSALISNRPK